MDRSRSPEVANTGGHRYARATADYSPSLGSASLGSASLDSAVDLSSPTGGRRSRELTSSEVWDILDRSQEIGNGRGRSFLNNEDGRYRRFADRLVTHQGGYAVLAKMCVLEPEPGVRSQRELGVEAGGRKLDYDQFGDVLWADSDWDRGEPTQGEPGSRPLLELLVSRGGKPIGSQPALGSHLARNIGTWVDAPHGDLWLENAQRLFVLPSVLDWRGNEVRAKRDRQVGEGESWVARFDPTGRLRDVMDTRPSGVWFQAKQPRF
jgi:hypothetical protein